MKTEEQKQEEIKKGHEMWNMFVVQPFKEAAKFLTGRPKPSDKEMKRRKARRSMQKASRG